MLRFCDHSVYLIQLDFCVTVDVSDPCVHSHVDLVDEILISPQFLNLGQVFDKLRAGVDLGDHRKANVLQIWLQDLASHLKFEAQILFVLLYLWLRNRPRLVIEAEHI